MSNVPLRSVLASAAVVALVAWTGCSSPGAPPSSAKANPYAGGHHPASLEEAVSLATARGVPVLVDFYSPT